MVQILGLLVTTLKLTLGHNTGSALNPAADFGPRLVMLGVGYGRSVVFGDAWWVIGPWAANLAGALLGGIVYDGFIFVGSESLSIVASSCLDRFGASGGIKAVITSIKVRRAHASIENWGGPPEVW